MKAVVRKISVAVFRFQFLNCLMYSVAGTCAYGGIKNSCENEVIRHFTHISREMY